MDTVAHVMSLLPFGAVGLTNFQTNLIANWFYPAVIIVAAFFMLRAVVRMQLAMLWSAILVVLVVSVFFFGSQIFFGQNGSVTQFATNTVRGVTESNTGGIN